MIANATLTDAAAHARWWGRYEIAIGAGLRLELGPLTVYAENRTREWRLHFDHGTRAEEDGVNVHRADPLVVPEGLPPTRFAQTREEGALTIGPALADRSVVARPESTVWLVGGDDITLYVSTPVWVSIATARTGRRLIELPSLRPSDTWFGPSPREGELCYAIRTSARIDLARLLRHPVRAITRVTVHNRAEDPVKIERLNLPLHRLALYASPGGDLWTDPVDIERLDSDAPAGRLGIVSGPPAEAGHAERLAAPRGPARERTIIRALSALLG